MKEYRSSGTLLVVAILFVMPLLFAPAIVTTSGVNEERTTSIHPDADYSPTDTDLTRVDWQLNQYENEGFERWEDPHTPSGISTYRTTEHFSGYSTENFTEGSRSAIMQSRSLDINHQSTAELKPSSWSYSTTMWNNLTMSFDWIIDALPVSTDGDYFRLEIELGDPGTHYLRYYLGCEVTGVTNSSYYGYYMIDAAPSGWNTFDRNLTQDFFDLTGSYPTQFEYLTFELRSVSSSYSRVFFDDLYVRNSSVIIGGSTNNGNFETSAYWYRQNNDPGDISQSTTRQEGDFSLNATALSNGNLSRARFYSRPEKRVSALNVDMLKFQWYIDDFTFDTDDTYAYVDVSCKNDTDEFHIYYLLCYGGYEFPLTYLGYNYINATGFNTTGQWNQFERSIWDDITTYNSTSFLIIEEIEIEVYSREVARISILFDDISYTCATLNDVGYEDQGDVGDDVVAWDVTSNPVPEFSVTNMAHGGIKAGNITVADSNYYSGDQDVGYLPVNNETDLWLDFWWRLEEYTGFTDDLISIQLSFDNNEEFGYILANGTAVDTGNGFNEFIIVPENGTEGTWFNFQRNIYADYLELFGTEPSTYL
ncbi:MAG: hypothetical protein ACW98Y_21550, partial [Candidatus Thorarchaeota archaeon]